MRDVKILPPSELTGIKFIKNPKKAAGVKGVTVAIRHLSEEIGLFEGLKLMTKVNQKDGLDCPGCAWPDPEQRSKLFEYCENGAKAIAEEATKKRVDPAFFERHSVSEMSTWSDYKIGRSGRITEPMYLAENANHYTPISWEDAFTKIGSKLKSIDADDAVFYTSGRTANETAFLYQLFVRAYGTNNLPDCSNMCHESSGTGLGRTLGIGKGSVTLNDLYEAEVVLVVGQNPGTNHPRMLSALQKCKANGGKVVHVNPLPEVGTEKFVDPQSPVEILKGGTKISDYFLQVRVNGDIAMLKLLAKGLFEAEEANPGRVLDREFIAQYASGFDVYRAQLNQENKDQLYKDCGLTAQQLKPVIELLANNTKIIICWAMGITQHVNGVANVQEIVNLLLLKGAVGKPGAGTCPVRGHSNVQGDRTMGIFEKPPTRLLDALDGRFHFQSPREHGYDVVESIEAMAENKVKFFFAMGGNFISATPDSAFTGKAMQNCDLTVQVSTKLNRSHLVTGKEAIILPCLARTDADIQQGKKQFYTVENSMGVVHQSKGHRPAPSAALKSEVDIVCSLAEATLSAQDTMKWSSWRNDYNLIRDEIEAVIPGFDDYNRKVRQSNGFHLPNGARVRQFNTSNGKAQFTVNHLPQVDPKEAEYIMITVRSHDQYNTTIYGLDDRYRGILNERRVVMMNDEDALERGWKRGQVVDIESVFRGEKRRVERFIVIPFNIPRKCVATYFPECNALVPIGAKAHESNTPASKFVEVNLYASAES